MGTRGINALQNLQYIKGLDHILLYYIIWVRKKKIYEMRSGKVGTFFQSFERREDFSNDI